MEIVGAERRNLNGSPGMASKQSSRPLVARPQVDPQVQERLREMAAELRHMLYGEKGCPEWGTLFRDIEASGMSVGLELARLLMEQSASEQVGQMPAEAMQVPDDVVEPAGTDSTLLETPAGDIAWEEPCGRLKQARKAFFPSQAGFGAGR